MGDKAAAFEQVRKKEVWSFADVRFVDRKFLRLTKGQDTH